MAHVFPDYEEIPHIADLQIIAYGKTMKDLFIHAAEGMFTVIGATGDDCIRESKIIELKADDIETLLVGFLEELLFFLEAGWLGKVKELNISRFKLSGNIQLLRLKTKNKEIKAVTYHDMKIFQEKGVFQTKITFDV